MPLTFAGSNRVNILNAIYSIATSIVGLSVDAQGHPLGGSKLGLMPTCDEITVWPYVVVLTPDPLGGVGDDGALVGGYVPRQMRGGYHATVEEYEIFVIYEYTPRDTTLVQVAVGAANLLEKTFVQNDTLNGTCYDTQIVGTQTGIIAIGNSALVHEVTRSQPFYAASLKLRVFDANEVD